MDKNDMDMNANNLQTIFSSPASHHSDHSDTTVMTGLDKKCKMQSRMCFEDFPLISDSPHTSTSGQIWLPFQGQSTIKRPPTAWKFQLHLMAYVLAWVPFLISQSSSGTNRCL